ncbi:Xenotropic and polytropic retrovirus receptor 1 [Madurella fahalii]|uniref:Xenotropic and polytropic retrovirus receptor 1 n=1 Tax=Madurella fahalii TaxID=1157608 RepID=A0ABQ0GLB0_9PEZI
MRFGEELISERVPEWASKYLDYKTGKKYIHAVAEAIHKADSGHVPPPQQVPSRPDSRESNEHVASPTDFEAGEGLNPRYGPYVPIRDDESYSNPNSRPGSRVPSSGTGRLSNVALPRLDVAGLGVNRYQEQPRERVEVVMGGDMEQHPQRHASSAPRRMMTRRQRAFTAIASSYPFTAVRSKFFDSANQPLNPTDLVEKAKNDFFQFMMGELDKVEEFYRTKEQEAGKRLQLLREQLYEMRNRRGDDAFRSDIRRKGSGDPASQGLLGRVRESVIELTSFNKSSTKLSPGVRDRPPLPPTPILTALPSQSRRDFVPKQVIDEDVSYPEAKRRLKVALHEFYRTLNLIQSYAALNRTAFQKLNKKYDKNARVSEKQEFVRHFVDKASFVKSRVIEEHMQTTEDLFARYFERGDTKAAITKLRSRTALRDTETMSNFSNGLLVGFGFVLSVQGLISAVRFLFDEDVDDDKQKVVSSHLQIYAGYFLMLVMGWLFVLICRLWSKHKVNYKFVFEFDPRHSLDWRKLAQFPSLFTLMFGVIFWLNFSAEFGGEVMFLYYPVVLLGATLLVLFLPLPVFHHQSRLWFATAHWRLLMAPFYSVEFRDVFLGDIYSSLRYTFANAELFFCVYVEGWDEPERCGSSRSRLMAFLGALPYIWRAIQCLRRYYDTRNVFPHLANWLKYMVAIGAVVALSEYRIKGGEMTLSFFISLSTLSTIYSSYWDIYMDFRLAQKGAPNYLRDILAYNATWWYYAAMIADPVLRMTWVFFVIFNRNIQHSTIVSFVVALVELFRRALWVIFRVENEHCVNIAQNKASRDIPLPYMIEVQQVD